MKMSKKKLIRLTSLLLCVMLLCSGSVTYASTSTDKNTTQAADIAGLRTILTHVTSSTPGTAGCSLKACKAAGELLDWMETNNTLITKKKLKAEVKRWYQKRDSSQYTKADYKNAWISVRSDMKSIRNQDTTITDLLDDAGYTLGHSSYSQKNYTRICNAFKAVLYPKK